MKIVVFIMLFAGLYSFQSFAQDPELIDNNWFLQYVEFDNVTHEMSGHPPGGPPFFFPHVEFETDGMSAQLTFNYFFSDVAYDISSPTFTVLDPHLTLGSCEILCDLEAIYLGIFYLGSGQERDFTYEFLYHTDDTISLTVFDDSGNRAVYWNQPYLLSVDDIIISKTAIYPNPTTDFLNIMAGNSQIYSLSVLTMDGKIIFKVNDFANRLDVSMLRNGVYFLEIDNEHGKSLQKFIKQ